MLHKGAEDSLNVFAELKRGLWMIPTQLGRHWTGQLSLLTRKGSSNWPNVEWSLARVCPNKAVVASLSPRKVLSFSAVKETLESRGVLNHLKARIRAEVFSALEDQREPRPFLSHENLLVNELIREYLEFNKYRYAASVLTAGGSGQASSLTSSTKHRPTSLYCHFSGKTLIRLHR